MYGMHFNRELYINWFTRLVFSPTHALRFLLRNGMKLKHLQLMKFQCMWFEAWKFNWGTFKMLILKFHTEFLFICTPVLLYSSAYFKIQFFSAKYFEIIGHGTRVTVFWHFYSWKKWGSLLNLIVTCYLKLQNRPK
jgi:hypothetical protein